MQETLHFRSNSSYFLIAVMVALMLGAGGWRLLNTNNNELYDVVVRANFAALELERQIGFGGLIHNFKNYVLREGEGTYYADVKANFDSAQEQIFEIQSIASQYGLELGFPHTLEMINDYSERLEIAKAMLQSGADNTAVDASVRYDDAPAVAEIQQSIALLGHVIKARMHTAARVNFIILYVMIVAMMAALIMALIFIRGKARSRNLIEASNRRLVHANKKLSSANKSLMQFATIASHDMKTPLRQISLLASIIDTEKDDHETVEESAHKIMALCGRLAMLISNLLDYAKTGYTELKLEALELSSLMREAVELVTAAEDPESVTVEVGELPRAFGDRELLSRVFQNFLENSIKYKRPGSTPTIRVSGSVDDDEVRIFFTDNGVGVAPARAEQIFDPLIRESTDETIQTGIGIGLSFVKTVAESHGGEVYLDRDYRDGARFVLHLPKRPITEGYI